jgi:hypothetical protein
MASLPIVLNPVVTGINAVPSFFSAPFVSGFEIVVTSSTVFIVAPGSARSSKSDYVIQVPTIQANSPSYVSVDISTVGVNGAYPLAIADVVTTDTMLPVYAIGDGSGKNAPAMVVATGNNFIPAGYTDARRIGWIFIDVGTLGLYQMFQSGHGLTRTYSFKQSIPVLQNGSQTTATAVTLDAVPQSAVAVSLLAEYLPAAASDYASLSNSSTSTAIVEIQNTAVALSKQVVEIALPVTTSIPSFYYFNSAAAGDLTLYVTKFTDDLSITAIAPIA